eukprot:scaffold52991_cov63-Phaeocystis_antarctica.AAC.1
MAPRFSKELAPSTRTVVASAAQTASVAQHQTRFIKATPTPSRPIALQAFSARLMRCLQSSRLVRCRYGHCCPSACCLLFSYYSAATTAAYRGTAPTYTPLARPRQFGPAVDHPPGAQRVQIQPNDLDSNPDSPSERRYHPRM